MLSGSRADGEIGRDDILGGSIVASDPVTVECPISGLSAEVCLGTSAEVELGDVRGENVDLSAAAAPSGVVECLDRDTVE